MDVEKMIEKRDKIIGQARAEYAETLTRIAALEQDLLEGAAGCRGCGAAARTTVYTAECEVAERGALSGRFRFLDFVRRIG